jgi:hypothetical protein
LVNKKTPPSGTAMQSKAPRKDQRWTLLFLGDRGKTITFKHFKGTVLTALFILMGSVLTAGWFWYQYDGAREEMRNYEKRIDNLKKVVLSLRNEKEILMARLVVAESRVEENLVKVKTVTNKPEPQPETKAESKAESKTPEQTPPENISVTADDFIIYHEPDNNTLRVQYKIRNLGSREEPVSGRTVLILKDHDEDPIKWLVLPKVPLKSGTPTGQYGRSFSIYNYRTMRFKVEDENGPDKYKNAVVYVFTTTGDPLLEKTFPVGSQ